MSVYTVHISCKAIRIENGIEYLPSESFYSIVALTSIYITHFYHWNQNEIMYISENKKLSADILIF